MKITLITVGKLKEKAAVEMCREYEKRLSAYCSLESVQIPDEDCDADEKRAVARESEAIKAKIPSDCYKIVCDIQGKKFTSEALAAHFNGLFVGGTSRLCFIVGGSCGLSDEIKQKADLRLSFSDMTFPHQLFRVMLLEQIYRAFRIIHNEPYHK